jgi:hypothetical protein
MTTIQIQQNNGTILFGTNGLRLQKNTYYKNTGKKWYNFVWDELLRTTKVCLQLDI